jgi:hypothetical protein
MPRGQHSKNLNKPSKGRRRERTFNPDESVEHDSLPSGLARCNVAGDGFADNSSMAAAEGSSSSSAHSHIRLAMWDLGQCDKKRCTGDYSGEAAALYFTHAVHSSPPARTAYCSLRMCEQPRQAFPMHSSEIVLLITSESSSSSSSAAV